jgi:hypothetical protein
VNQSRVNADDGIKGSQQRSRIPEVLEERSGLNPVTRRRTFQGAIPGKMNPCGRFEKKLL